jgi:hypothetical protein
MLGLLLQPGRATVTNLICSHGRQHEDWSADYRLYSQGRADPDALFGQVRRHLLDALPPGEPLVAALDDTLVRKTGTHIHGVGYKRDPLGPAFQTNLVRGQRFLQISGAWPLADGPARLIPLDLLHAPTTPKLPKNAAPAQTEVHREALKQQNLNLQALKRIGKLRRETPESRHLILTGDGSYTNQTLLRGLPEGVTYIGRTRKDTALHHLPGATAAGHGRPRAYGADAPTPEQLRQDESIPWQQVEAFAAGRRHRFRIKTLGPVLWRKTGPGLPLLVVVIAPLAYRRKKGSKANYRQPAYLVCTDPALALEKLLQYYLWRWGIEVNFREQKSLLGTGQAQVRTAASNQNLPAMTVAAYALLWVSALQTMGRGGRLDPPPRPKWRRAGQREGSPPSTGDLLRLLRHELWADALGKSTFLDFAEGTPSETKPKKPKPDLSGILFGAA